MVWHTTLMVALPVFTKSYDLILLLDKNMHRKQKEHLRKAKFHHASWFRAGLKLVRAKFHYTSWFGAGSKPVRSQLRTS